MQRRRRFLGVIIALAAMPVWAVECLAPNDKVTPVLVLQHVAINIGEADSGELERSLRERLDSGGRYRVLLPDQYRYALSNKRIDRCTPSFGVSVEIGMSQTDPGAAFGLGGFVRRHEFKADIEVDILPDDVTLDSFSISDKADSFISGKPAGQAFERLLEKLSQQLEVRRDGWVRTDIPGFERSSAGP